MHIYTVAVCSQPFFTCLQEAAADMTPSAGMSGEIANLLRTLQATQCLGLHGSVCCSLNMA